MRSLVAVAVVLAVTFPARADDESRAVLEKAINGASDRKVLDDALAALDRMVAEKPKDAERHYARGWVLSRLERPADAIAEYDKALALEPRLTEAAYNAGVVLARQKREKDALAYFEKALAINPKLVDAAYNAGQSYYNLKNFARAAERWTTAQAGAPDDVAIAYKLVQAYNALHKDAEAAKARERVFALYKAGKVDNAKDYIFDQFEVGSHRVFAFESFDTSGDFANVYTFDVVDNDNIVGSVRLETSAVIREHGHPYLLALHKQGGHSQFGTPFKTLPSYKDLKPLVIEVIKQKF
jgi:tetratricopeptide (TPR) repeat protein